MWHPSYTNAIPYHQRWGLLNCLLLTSWTIPLHWIWCWLFPKTITNFYSSDHTAVFHFTIFRWTLTQRRLRYTHSFFYWRSHVCILFLLSFYSASQHFWNWGYIYPQKIQYFRVQFSLTVGQLCQFSVISRFWFLIIEDQLPFGAVSA